VNTTLLSLSKDKQAKYFNFLGAMLSFLIQRGMQFDYRNHSLTPYAQSCKLPKQRKRGFLKIRKPPKLA